MNELKKRLNKNRHDFLHTFFPSPTGYQQVQVNGWYLINQFNANNNCWEVAIYSPEAYEATKTKIPRMKNGGITGKLL